jgi:hypothetical protein
VLGIRLRASWHVHVQLDSGHGQRSRSPPRGAALRGLPLAPGMTSQLYWTRQR